MSHICYVICICSIKLLKGQDTSSIVNNSIQFQLLKQELPRVAAILSLTEVESAGEVYVGSGKLAAGVAVARRRGDAGGVYVVLPTTGGVYDRFRDSRATCP